MEVVTLDKLGNGLVSSFKESIEKEKSWGEALGMSLKALQVRGVYCFVDYVILKEHRVGFYAGIIFDDYSFEHNAYYNRCMSIDSSIDSFSSNELNKLNTRNLEAEAEIIKQKLWLLLASRPKLESTIAT